MDDRQIVFNALKAAVEDVGVLDIVDIMAVFENLPPADVPQWIPCSERMPENGRTVLVTDWGETDFGRRYDGRWWSYDDVLKDVSAWMPLPEPYKKDGDEE